MRAVKLDTSITMRCSYEEKTSIKRLSERLQMDQSALLRRLIREALCRASLGESGNGNTAECR